MVLQKEKSQQQSLGQLMAGQAGAYQESVIHLSDELKRQIDGRARRDLIKVVLAQLCVGLMVVSVVAVLAGTSAGLSALAGFGAYFLPNTLLALRLVLSTYSPKGADPFVFLVGELAKIGSALFLLFLVGRFGGDRVQWLYVIVALIATLKSYFLVMCVEGIKRK